MKIQPSELYKDHDVYKSLRKNEGRYYVTMVHRATKAHRIMAYARYLMASHIGRELEKIEVVDHIDENKLNDCIDNLQILTNSENVKKNAVASGRVAEVIEKICPCCKIAFKLKARTVRSRTKAGVKNFFCSRQCVGAGAK